MNRIIFLAVVIGAASVISAAPIERKLISTLGYGVPPQWDDLYFRGDFAAYLLKRHPDQFVVGGLKVGDFNEMNQFTLAKCDQRSLQMHARQCQDVREQMARAEDYLAMNAVDFCRYTLVETLKDCNEAHRGGQGKLSDDFYDQEEQELNNYLREPFHPLDETSSLELLLLNGEAATSEADDFSGLEMIPTIEADDDFELDV